METHKMEKKLYAGTISGIKGYSGVMIVTDVPFDIGAVSDGTKAMIGFSEKFARECVIGSWKKIKNAAEIKIIGIDSDKEANKHKEMGVFIERKNVKKEKHTTFTDEIAGCVVIDIDTGREIGKITEIWDLPANNVWLVEMPEGNLPVPVIDDVIIEQDFKNKIVKIRLINGLLDLLHDDGERDE